MRRHEPSLSLDSLGDYIYLPMPRFAGTTRGEANFMLGAGIFCGLLALAVFPLIVLAQGFPFEPALAFLAVPVVLGLGLLATVLVIIGVRARG